MGFCSRATFDFFSRSHGEGDEGHEAREQCGEGPCDAEGRALRCDRVQLRDQEEGGEGGLGALEDLIPAQLKATGKFTIPGITMIKLKKKPATKAGKRMAFGKEVFVKAKPARTLVKCYTVKALKDAF